MNKPDCNRRECFACNNRKRCDILTEALERCPFYKTRTQVVDDRTKAYRRLMSSPQREYYLDKYYRGEKL